MPSVHAVRSLCSRSTIPRYWRGVSPELQVLDAGRGASIEVSVEVFCDLQHHRTIARSGNNVTPLTSNAEGILREARSNTDESTATLRANPRLLSSVMTSSTTDSLVIDEMRTCKYGSLPMQLHSSVVDLCARGRDNLSPQAVSPSVQRGDDHNRLSHGL